VKTKLAFEIFMSGVVVFDIFGSAWRHLPIWEFFPMWVGVIVEIEVGARVLGRISRWIRSTPKWPSS